MKGKEFLFYVKGVYHNVNDSVLQDIMLDQLLKTYNDRFCPLINGGVTEALNKEYHSKYGDSMDQYDRFMIDGYTKLVVDVINSNPEKGSILDYFVGDEADLRGRLKWNPNATVEYVLVPA